MRYVRMLLIHFEDALAERSRSFVWFLIALINPLMLLLFWRGAILEKPDAYGQWNIPSIMSYYLLLIIAGAFLQVHIDEKIAYSDIQQGQLANYLTRPFSYLLWNFFIELPYRVIQGSFGVFGWHGTFWKYRGDCQRPHNSPSGSDRHPIGISAIVLF